MAGLLGVRSKLQVLFLQSTDTGLNDLSVESLDRLDAALSEALEESMPGSCRACGLPAHLHNGRGGCPTIAMELSTD